MRHWSVLAALLPWAVAANEAQRLQNLQKRLTEVTAEHQAAQKQLKDVSEDLLEMEMYMRQLRRATHLKLEDDAKKDRVLSSSFRLLRGRSNASEATGNGGLAALAERVKVKETDALNAMQRVKELRQNLTQQQDMFQAQAAQLTMKQRQISELQREVTSLQAEATEDVAADHQLELKYEKQAQEYEKQVEQLDAELQGAKKQLTALQAIQVQDQQGMTEGRHQLQRDENHLHLQQQKRQEEESHEDAMQREVVQLKDDLDLHLVSAGAQIVTQVPGHEQRLTELVRVAAKKQEDIQQIQANVSGLEAEVSQASQQLDHLKAKENLDAQKVNDEIQELRQKKVYRVRAAQEMYHKLPELFRHRAKMDEERRIAEASEAVRLRQQQRTLSEQKLRESEKEEEEELHTELHSSKQRLQNIDPLANKKKTLAKKRLQQLRAKLAETKKDEAKEMKKFTERSKALQKEFGRDEARDRKKTLEKARAVEKMQSELLSLEDNIDTLERQQNHLATEAAHLQSSISLKQAQDQQELHRASAEAERRSSEEAEMEKQERRHVHDNELRWKALLQDEELKTETRLASLKHHLEEKVTELRSSDTSELQDLQSLAKRLRLTHTAAGKVTKFMEKEPRLASAVKHTLKMDD